MINAKNYPNTVEFAAEKYYNSLVDQLNKNVELKDEYATYKELSEAEKDDYRYHLKTVLNVVNFFEGKTCKDCGYFDPEMRVCSGEDKEHEEKPDSQICETFAPECLVGVQT